jgi:hypothetical protein
VAREFRIYALSAALACFSLDCSGAPVGSDGETRGRSVSIVELTPDGPHLVASFRGGEGSLTIDGLSALSCTNVDRFYDAPGAGGNELCVTGAGTATVASLASAAGISFGSVASFTPAQSAGYFSASPPGVNDHCSDFPISNTLQAVSVAPANLAYLTLGSDCVRLTCGTGQFECTIDCEGYLKQFCFETSVALSTPPYLESVYCAHHATCP